MKEKMIIKAKQRVSLHKRWQELYQHREVLWILAYRDLKGRYVQTFLGLAWVVFQPVITLLIFSFIFGQAVRVDSGGVPYPLFAFSGLWIWSYWAFMIARGAGMAVTMQSLSTKIYFPRLILPLSQALVGLVDLGVNLLLLFLLFLYYQIFPSSHLAFLPFILLHLLISAWGVGIWLSALVVRFRDLQPLSNFILQIGLYVSPVIYPSGLIPERFQWMYFLNPMAGVIEGTRWALLGTDFPVQAWLSFGVAWLIFISSLFYFWKIERSMTDWL